MPYYTQTNRDAVLRHEIGYDKKFWKVQILKLYDWLKGYRNLAGKKNLILPQ